jgi:hypothetical protein
LEIVSTEVGEVRCSIPGPRFLRGPARLFRYSKAVTAGHEMSSVERFAGRSVHVHVDGDSIAGITAVVQVVSVSRIVDYTRRRCRTNRWTNIPARGPSC